GLSALLVHRIGFLGIPVAYVAANTVCAILLLYNFAPGFFSRMIRSAGWLVPCVVSAGLCGRLASTLVTGDATATAIQRLILGALPFSAVYLLGSFVLAPVGYRAKFLSHFRLCKFCRGDQPFCLAPRSTTTP